MVTIPLLLCLLAAQPVPAPPPLPTPPLPTPEADDGQLVLFLLLDDGDKSRGVDRAIIRRVTLPPYDASTVSGAELRILRAQGFKEPAPAWRIGYAGEWTEILTTCPCCPLWDELEFYVALHHELGAPEFIRFVNKRPFWVGSMRRERQWPVPPTRAIVVRDFIVPKVWGR